MERMMKLRAAKGKALKALEKARDALIDENGVFKALTDEESAEIDRLDAEIKSLSVEIEREEKLQADLAKAAEPADNPADKGEDDAYTPNPEIRKSAFARAKGGISDGVLKAGAVMIAVAAKERGLIDDPITALRNAGHGGLADEMQYEMRSMNASIFSAGGAVVPSYMSQEIIDFLYPSTGFLQLNPMRIPMPNGNYEQPGGASQATAGYGEELANASATEATFRSISMIAKELKALIPISNQLLDFSLSGTQAFVERHLNRVMSLTMDNKFLLGDGQGGNPHGIFNIPGIGSGGQSGTYSDATAPTQAEVDAVARAMVLDLTGVGNNVSIASAKWIMTPRTAGYLQDLKDGNGNYVYRGMQTDGQMSFKRRPVIETTNLPENLGGSSDATYLALVAGDHVLMGEAGDMGIQVSKEASYYDANGTLRSAFQRGETLLLSAMRHDVTLDQVKAVTVASDIRWGA